MDKPALSNTKLFWLGISHVNLNMYKTVDMCFSRKWTFASLVGSISIGDNNSISVAQSVKFLDVMLDSKFSWDNDIDYFCNKINPFCFTLKSLKLSMPSLLNIYHAYVYSRQKYNFIVFLQKGANIRLQKWAVIF